MSQLQRTDGHSYQPDYLHAECGQHAANLPIFAFVKNDLTNNKRGAWDIAADASPDLKREDNLE